MTELQDPVLIRARMSIGAQVLRSAVDEGQLMPIFKRLVCSPSRRQLPLVLAGTAALGATQYAIARAGMHAGEHTEGLDGIGTAVKYLLGDTVLTLTGLVIGAMALRLRSWALGVLTAGVTDAVLLSELWNATSGAHQEARQLAAFEVALLVPAVVVWSVSRRC